MGKFEKPAQKVLSGTSDKNIRFADLRKLLEQLGFTERIQGSHPIFYKEKIINLQPLQQQAKAYPARQVREIILKYNLLNET